MSFHSVVYKCHKRIFCFSRGFSHWKLYLIVFTFILTLYVIIRQKGHQSSWLNYLLLNRDDYIDFDDFDNVLGSVSPIVPNIVHFIKIGNQSGFAFEELVCIRAAWLAQKPKRILIHCNYCDSLKVGKYWPQVSRIPNVEFVPVTVPVHVWGRKLSSVQHASDVLRIHILRQFGGIYLDTDTFLVRSLDNYRRFELAIGVPPKQYLGTQIIVAHRSARFLTLWLDSYRNYKPDRWYYNAGELPTTSIIFKQPGIVHPVLWDFGVHDLRAALYDACSAHWRDFHAIHLLSRHRTSYVGQDKTAPRAFDENNIKTYNKTFGEMARYVLYAELWPVLDDRQPLPVTLVALTNISSLPRWCGGEYSLKQWKSCTPMGILKSDPNAIKFFEDWSD